MGIVLRVSQEDWLTMKALRYDIAECAKINTNGKFDLAIKCNKNALNLFYKELYDNAA